ncbi:MAG: hypothetical protein JRF72_04570 [Deltaproteobacteria bacterium]|jgi:hypothetical protein|nr:hypothetical protein [Deltaproteobacteria bacterium]
MLLSKFANEVLSRGASALLPYNLNAGWLAELQKMADDFLDLNFQSENCADVGDDVDPILSACVSEILFHQQGGTTEIAPDELVKKITIYAIQITIETIRRESRIEVERPSLENILNADRLAEMSGNFPDMAKFLDKVCLAEE